MKYNFILVALIMLVPSYLHAEDYLSTNHLYKILEKSVKTWKYLKDSDVVKQKNDISCGAASASTILRFFYYKDISEKDIIDELDKMGEHRDISFLAIKKAVDKFGFQAVGLKLSFKKLKTMKMPSIVHFPDQKHFAVIRGVNEQGEVSLGDPSLGNCIFSKEKFKSMWETNHDSLFEGRILLIFPEDKSLLKKVNQNFFKPPVANTQFIRLLSLNII